MLRTERIAALALLLLLGCFIAGLYALFSLRFETGDVFPAYSSLRADPLGVKAFYQALERIPGVSVQRSYRDLSKLKTGRNTTLFCLGVGPDFLRHTPKDLADRMEFLAQGGARLVISFLPEHRTSVKRKASRSWEKERHKERQHKAEAKQGQDQNQGQGAEERKKAEGDEKRKNEPEAERLEAPEAPLAESWEIAPALLSLKSFKKIADRTTPCAQLSDRTEELPESIDMNTRLYFRHPGADWTVLYSLQKHPVLLERSLGAGSIVLVADSYLFSNEAMRDARYSTLLARIVGESGRIVFDEFHLGVVENRGVMALVQQYRLHAFLAALILLASLYLWQTAAPFAPSRGERSSELERAEVGADKDQLSGLISLLRRSLEPGDALEACFKEWRKSMDRNRHGMQEKMERVQQLFNTEAAGALRPREAAALYRKITEILSERKHP